MEMTEGLIACFCILLLPVLLIFFDFGHAAAKCGDCPPEAAEVIACREDEERNYSVLRFRNPINNHIEESSDEWFPTLLFGGFYFLSKGIWTHFLLYLLLVPLTLGIAWFVYPFYARSIVEQHYLRKGWIKESGDGKQPAAAPPRPAASTSEPAAQVPRVEPKIQAATQNVLSVASEIEKLASLKDKGILSEEEFQAQKKKLLDAPLG